MTSGLHPAEMIVIAARPSMGKTAFAMNVVRTRRSACWQSSRRFQPRNEQPAASSAYAVFDSQNKPAESPKRILERPRFPFANGHGRKARGILSAHRRHSRPFDFGATGKGEAPEGSARHPAYRNRLPSTAQGEQPPLTGQPPTGNLRDFRRH